MSNGDANKIPPVEVKCPMDKFENAIREIGVTAACEWFGFPAGSEFTGECIELLTARSNGDDR